LPCAASTGVPSSFLVPTSSDVSRRLVRCQTQQILDGSNEFPVLHIYAGDM